MGRAAAAVSLALFIASCHTEKDEAVRAEAGRVAHDVEALRNAPNAEKSPLRKALDGARCTTDDVCALKKACSDAYAVEENALAGVAAVAQAARQPGMPVPPEAAELLARAEAELGRAKELAVQCADLEAAARRRYRL